MIKLAITNLGKYNEGVLTYGWLSLPFSDEELEEVLEEIGINEEYEEWFISDYETELNIKIGEYENIHHLNDLVEELEYLESDIDILNGILEIQGDGLEILVDILRDGRYSVINGVKTYTDLGYYIIEEFDCFEFPSHIANYFNYEQYGEESDYTLIDGDMAISIY